VRLRQLVVNRTVVCTVRLLLLRLLLLRLLLPVTAASEAVRQCPHLN
jgi:hypothetical protein